LTAPIGVPSGSRRNTTIKQPPIGRQTIDYLDQATIDYRDHSQHRPRLTVYVARVHQPLRGRWDRGKSGWSGAALDNVFVERLWRNVKYEDIYIKEYDRVPDLESGLTAYFQFYDEEHPHQSLDYQTPGEVYRGEVRGG
jgi:transposase InsO family protein